MTTTDTETTIEIRANDGRTLTVTRYAGQTKMYGRPVGEIDFTCGERFARARESCWEPGRWAAFKWSNLCGEISLSSFETQEQAEAAALNWIAAVA